MVTILDEVPSFAQLFGRQLGGGIGRGIETGIGDRLRGRQQREQQIQKNLGRVGRDTSSFLNRRDPYKQMRDPEFVQQLENSAKKYIQQGYDGEEALDLAFQEGIKSEGNLGGQKSTNFNDIAKSFSPINPNATGEKGFLQKLFGSNQTEEQKAAEVKRNEEAGKKLPYKLARIPVAAYEGLLDLARGQSIYGGEGTLAKAGWEGEELPEHAKGLGITRAYDKATNNKGMPEDEFEQAAQGLAFGPTGAGFELFSVAMKKAGVPEPVADALAFIGFMTHGQLKSGAKKLGSKLLNEARAVAKEVGRPVESVIADASSQAGVDLAKAAQGDVRELAKLRKSITVPPEVAQRVKATEKGVFNEKAATAERKAFGSKLPESPFQEYFDIDAREAHKVDRRLPETQWQYEQFRLKNEPLIEKQWQEVQKYQDYIKQSNKEMRKATGEEKTRLEGLHQMYEGRLEHAKEMIKDLEYEVKYARPRPTEEQIQGKIDEAVARFEEETKNPTPEGQEKIKKDIDTDQKYIERAQKLIERGELPGEIRPDTHIKMKKAYLDRYKAAIQEQREILREMKSVKDKESLQRKAQIRKFIETLENRTKRLEADIVNQTDKIKAMRAIKPTSGAFYREQLKSLKKDIIDFQHDFFKAKPKAETAGEIKTQKAVEGKFPKFEQQIKEGEVFAKNPTIEKAIELSEKPSEGTQAVEAAQEMRKGLEKSSESIQKGRNPAKQIDSLTKWTNRIKKALIRGAVLGTVQALCEEYLGFKPSQSMISLLFGAGGVYTYGVSPLVNKFWRNVFEQAHVKKLQELRYNPQEFHQYVRNLQEDYGEAKTKRIIKKTQQAYKKAA